MKIVAVASRVERTGITVILTCNLCCWTPNYLTLIPPITWHHTQLPPIIEPNQDFSQPKLAAHIFCLSFVSVALFSTDQGSAGSQLPLGWVLSWDCQSSPWSEVVSALLTCFCSVNQSSKKYQFVSGSYHPTIWKIFHVKSRLLSPVAIGREPHWLRAVFSLKYGVAGDGSIILPGISKTVSVYRDLLSQSHTNRLDLVGDQASPVLTLLQTFKYLLKHLWNY